LPIFLGSGRNLTYSLFSGRADWVWLDPTGRSVGPDGSIAVFMNMRGEGKGMRPNWTRAQSSHAGGFTGLIEGDSRRGIQFGRVYGSTRADVSVLTPCLFRDLKVYGHKKP
jgi:hypothetical protein